MKPTPPAAYTRAQRARLAFEGQQRARPAAAGHAAPNAVEPGPQTLRPWPSRRSSVPGQRTQLADGLQRVLDAAVPVRVCPDARPLQPDLEIGLRTIGHDQVGLEREDAFRVGIEQGADAGQGLHLGGEVIEAADGDDMWSRADGEQHLGDGRDERDDPRGRPRRGLRRRRSCRRGPRRLSGGDASASDATASSGRSHGTIRPVSPWPGAR